MPLISIILPFRDAAATIEQSLESILNQTERDWELVAIDDGSRDGSSEIVGELAGRDDRIRHLRPGRIGLVAALGLGLTEARADLVARMDADDVMRPDRLRAQRAFLDEHPDVALVGCRVALFPPGRIQAGMREYARWQNSCVSPEEIAANIYVESPFAHPSVMFRRAAIVELGGYRDGEFPEDYELWLRMSEAGLRMAKVPEVLLDWREGASRASRNDPRYAREVFDRLRADFLSRDARVRSGREVAYWGAGSKTRRRARLLVDRGVRPMAWIDIDPRKIGTTVDGAAVVAPDWLVREPRPFVLVYVTNHGARDLIAERLDAMGYVIGDDWLAVG